MTIIVIEDSDPLRRVAVRALDGAFPGATIVAPESWEATEQALRGNSTAVVITDGDLWPGSSAKHVFALLKVTRGDGNAAAVLYSANVDKYSEFTRRVEKPGLSELISLVGELL